MKDARTPEQVLEHFETMGRTLYETFLRNAEVDIPPPWNELSLREKTAWSRTHEEVEGWYF